MSSRIIGSLVMRNEADRYLEQCLTHNMQFCDLTVVLDDRSSDDSVEIAYGLGCEVTVRDEIVPSFIEHEGRFRQAAWDALSVKARDGDWVFSFDADEFLVTSEAGNVANHLRRAIEKASDLDLAGIRLDIPEVFALSPQGVPLIRRDGFWRSIYGVRIFRWQQPGRFLDRPMACGSAPLYVEADGISREAFGLALLHYGYLDFEDRLEKYDRHISSIMTEPTLETWSGSFPEFTINA
jgi:hypothetical protein